MKFRRQLSLRILFFKGLAILSLCVLVSACAKPRYENPENLGEAGSSGQGAPQEKASQCSVRFAASGYCLSWNWELKPTDAEVGSLTFKIYRGNVLDDSPLLVDPNLAPSLLLWMPSMGHGSSPIVVTKLDVGTYRASEVFFTMGGEWDLHFQIKNGKTVQDEAVVRIRF